MMESYTTGDISQESSPQAYAPAYEQM